MILIADSGSTKTDWVLIRHVDHTVVATFQTQGINPVHQTPDTIRSIIATIPSNLPSITQLFFYGSGCIPTYIPFMQQLLSESLHCSDVQVFNDLLGAARALCGHEVGIACILGTGSNSCLYDGNNIISNTPPLGYILGDEGSGAVLGRTLLNALYKGMLPEDLRFQFESDYGVTLPDIIQRVYREPMANRWLASLAPFVCRHLDCTSLRKMVVDHFCRFFRHNLSQYDVNQLPVQIANLPVHAVGSIAWYFREQLNDAAVVEGFQLGRVVQSPMEGLIAFHSSCS